MSNRLPRSPGLWLLASGFVFTIALAWILDPRRPDLPQHTSPLSPSNAGQRLLSVEEELRLLVQNRVPAPEVTPTDYIGIAKLPAVRDDEWIRLPRGTTPHFPEMVLSPSVGLLSPDRLFRHKRLNPRDTYVTERNRDEFSRWFTRFVGRIGRARYVLTRIAVEETNRRIASGEQQPLRFRTDAEARVIIERKGGIQPHTTFCDTRVYERGDTLDQVYRKGNHVYGIRFSSLSGCRDALAHIEFLSKTLATEMIQWFVQHQCLTPNESLELLEEVFHSTSRD